MTDAQLRDEAGRQAALDRYAVLDTVPDARFDRITALVRAVFNVPIALVSLVDRERQWFKSCDGLDTRETPRGISFCTHTIRQRTPLIIPDALVDPRFQDSPLVTGPPHIRSYAGMPLTTPDGYNVGSLCAIDREPRDFSPEQIAMLRDFGQLVVAELELRQIAQSDFLTGALSRRAFVARLDDAITRRDRDAALVMFDIDHFKSINDRFGHATGDDVLQQIAQSCTEALRSGDSFGRLGGEEFGLLLPDTSVAAALAAAERCRQAIAALSIDVGEMLHVTASFGIAPLTDDVADATDWLCHADTALYAAKSAGRNRCRLMGPVAVAA